MSDPLVQVLLAVQSTANDQGASATENWESINQRLINMGAPTLGSDDETCSENFGKEFDADPAIQELVDHFDEHGLVIKTNNQAEPTSGGGAEPSLSGQAPKGGMMKTAATQAAKRAFS